jgi:hypothetical protein
MPQLDNYSLINIAVKNANFMLAVSRGHGLKDKIGTPEKIIYSIFVNFYVFPVRDIGRGKHLPGKINKPEKYFFLSGSLGFNYSVLNNSIDPLTGENPGKSIYFSKKVLIYFVLNNGS